ncbi:MAG: hypothetical protein ACT4TC_03765 [Myxococcaceae bacterium]
MSLWLGSACGGDRAALHLVVSNESAAAPELDGLRVLVLDVQGGELSSTQLVGDEVKLPARFNFVVDPSSKRTAPYAELIVRVEAWRSGTLIHWREERSRLVRGEVTVLQVSLVLPRPDLAPVYVGDSGIEQASTLQDAGASAVGERDRDAGTPDAGLPDAGPPDAGPPDAGATQPRPPARLAFKSDPTATQAGECAGPWGLELRDETGRPTVAGEATLIRLSAPSSSTPILFEDPACQTPLAQVAVPARSGEVAFYFSRKAAGTVTLQASAAQLQSASGTVLIRPGAPVKAVIPTPSQTLQAGACSGQVYVQLHDVYGNVVRPNAGVSLTLSGSPGVALFSDACMSPTASATVTAGDDVATFYFRAAKGGAAAVRAGASGIDTAVQSNTVLPAVRTGACTLATPKNMVVCPVVPPQRDISRTLLLFQATSTGSAVSETSVRCRLTSPNEILCDRAAIETTVNISWQTAELGTGLRVQHLEASCAGKSAEMVSIQPVTLSKTFVLYSQYAVDLDYTSENFVSAQLASATSVELRASSPCPLQQRAAIQVVEMEGITVTRGETPPMTGLTQTVANLPVATPGASVLLFSYRTNAGSTVMCDRMVRGELTSATALGFARGHGVTCTASTVDAIAWQRIDFGGQASTQQVTSSVGAGVLVTSSAIAVVDPTRTLVFAGNQAQSGQGGGEGSFAANDTLGEMLGFHALTDGQTLRISRGTSQGSARWTSFVVQLKL